MAKGITLADAVKIARREMGEPIKATGFDHREINGHVINVLYFTHEYSMALSVGVRNRISVFVNGKSRFGDSF